MRMAKFNLARMWECGVLQKAFKKTHIYQQRMAWAFNKKVKARDIKVGDLVMKQTSPGETNRLKKWEPKWTGPYVLKMIVSGGAVHLEIWMVISVIKKSYGHAKEILCLKT